MQRNRALAAVAALCFSVVSAAGAPLPKLDKPKLEAYIRYAEAFTPDVQFSIDDPVPSAFPGYSRVVAHLTKGHNRLDRVYYVTADGRHFVNGAIWDLNASPFLDTLQHLPTDGPSFGPPEAKVTIVVFSDFECPYCRELAKTIRDNIPQKFPNDVRVIFQDFPIDSIHPWARAAAEASHCIADQEIPAFWAFHDWIFEHQQEVNQANPRDQEVNRASLRDQEVKQANLRDQVLDFAKNHALDRAKLAGCIDSHTDARVVDQSLRAGQALQIEQTPTLFVNGRTVGGAISWDQLKSLIDLELKRPAEVPAPSAEKCCEVRIPRTTKK